MIDCLLLIIKPRKRTLKVNFSVKKREKNTAQTDPHLAPHEKLSDSIALPLQLPLCCGDNMVFLVGRSPETEHSMSNWIELFFLIWVGAKEGGGGKTEHRWEASVPIIGGYWPPALTDSRKCGYYADRCQSCTCTATFMKYYTWKGEKVHSVFTLPAFALGAEVIMRTQQERKRQIRVWSPRAATMLSICWILSSIN